MVHKQCGGGAELDRKVTVGNAVEGISCGRIKAEYLCRSVTVDREGGSRQCSGAQRRDIQSPPAVHQATVVSLQHFVPGQKVVAKGHRLGHLQMGESGHDGTRVLSCQRHDAGLQARQLGADGIECGAQVQT